MIIAKVIADSISLDDARLTTFVLTYPRFIHSEIMTHRVFSRNASSSRAIPVAKMIEAIKYNPAMPEYWGKNRPGMSAAEELDDNNPANSFDCPEYKGVGEKAAAKMVWLEARDRALYYADILSSSMSVHKQISNRGLEPWMNITVVCTATDWDNFYWLRTDSQAQPEFRILAERMLEAHNLSNPVTMSPGEWHLPFVSAEEQAKLGLDRAKMASVARAARVSYNNHDGTNPDIVKDEELHNKLLTSGHMSPTEHQATPSSRWDRHKTSNFSGWTQYRETIPNQNRTSFTGLIKKKHAIVEVPMLNQPKGNIDVT